MRGIYVAFSVKQGVGGRDRDLQGSAELRVCPARVVEQARHATQVTGYVSAEAGSGNVSASGLSGTADLETGSGDVRGTALSGPQLTLGSGSGDVNVSGLTSPRVVASDGSGDITLIFTKVPSYVHVKNASGNVTLILPPGKTTLYRVNASTSSGNRVINVPNSSLSHRRITVTDGSGDISITN